MTDALTAADLADIRCRLDAATPGPWEPVYPYRDESDYVRIFADSTYLGSIGNTDFDPEQIKANAELIAHAPTDVSRLLAEVERLQSENADLRNDVNAALSQDGGESLLRTVAELREKNTELHRRCQQAEAAVAEAMRQWEQHGGPRGGNFGSGLLAAENARLRSLVPEEQR